MKKMVWFAVWVICLLWVVQFSGTAHGSEAVDEYWDRFSQEFPNVEAIRQRFGDQARLTERTAPGIDVMVNIKEMEYPGIKISTAGFTVWGENKFYIYLMDVTEPGLMDFTGIDIGSSREDVIERFGNQWGDYRGNNTMSFYDSFTGNTEVAFVIEGDKV